MYDPVIRARIAANIRAERARRKLSQEALGSAMGLTRAVVSDIECGRRSVWAHELPALCRALNIDINTLFSNREEAA